MRILLLRCCQSWLLQKYTKLLRQSRIARAKLDTDCWDFHIPGHRRARNREHRVAILIPLLLFLLGLSGAGVAQLVEHLICNQRVGGSIPSASSTRKIAGERGGANPGIENERAGVS